MTHKNQRKEIVYKLKKQNYEAIKQIIKDKKTQMLNIIPDDNSVIDSEAFNILKLDDPGASNKLKQDLLAIKRKNSLVHRKRPTMILFSKNSEEKLSEYNLLYKTLNNKFDNIIKSNSSVKPKKSEIIAR